MSAGTTELDTKIAKFQEIQESKKFKVRLSNPRIYFLCVIVCIAINKLFSQKTTFLSQFNENTLVSGVS